MKRVRPSNYDIMRDRMELEVEAAQTKMHTRFPVVNLDRRLHAEPKRMRSSILETLDALPPAAKRYWLPWAIAEVPGITFPFPDVWSFQKWTIALLFCSIRMTRLMEI